MYIGAMNMDVHEAATTKSLLCADKYSTLEILYIQSMYIHVCVYTYEGLGIPSLFLMDCLCMCSCVNGKAWNCFSVAGW